LDRDARHPFDRWIAASLLQKAIRRSEIGLAEQAAVALFRFRGSATWKRFLVIAVEDIGVACPETLIEVTGICSDRDHRRKIGGDEETARYLARRLAAAPKDRSADLLASGVCYHPWLEAVRSQVRRLTTYERLDWVADPSRSFCERSVAAWFASGIGAEHKRYNGEEVRLLLSIFRDIDVPQELIEAVAQSVSRTREPFCALLPLLWLAAQFGFPHKTVVRSLPPTRTVVGVPLWTLDMHTRAGRAAIQRFMRENEAIRQVLQESVQHNRHTEAAHLGAFYVDGGCCATSLDWPLGAEIERLGIEADFAHAGVPPQRIGRLLATFRTHVESLDDVREDVLVRYLEDA
jgi:hypothetical protein